MTERAAGSGDLKAICDELRDEPLFHLSLHSKELFHSNFLAWLIGTYPVAAAQIFGRWVPFREGTARARVRLERSHLDLAVELSGFAPFIIENKVFSPPDEDQLDAYAAGKLAGLQEPSLFLLSLADPKWPSGEYRSSSGRIWRYISYVDLADALADAVRDLRGKDDPNTPFAAELLDHYRNFALTLHRLVAIAGVVGRHDAVDLPQDARELLRAVRLHDAVSKLRADQAIRAARVRTGDELSGHEIRWESLFTNGAALTAAFLRLPNDDWLGWQYQRDQWRVAVITGHLVDRSPEVRARRHAYVAEQYATWFDFSPLAELTGRSTDAIPPTELRAEYNGYNPDFVYRYRKMPGLTVAELAALSHHYLTAAAATLPSKRLPH